MRHETTIATASHEYASRPKDERFPSLDALITAAQHDRELSRERTYNLKDLRARVAEDGDVLLASPRGEAKLSHWSFGQLARTIGAPAGYLRSLSGLTHGDGDHAGAALVAANINHGLTYSPFGTEANLLVRGANGQPPVVRACTSDTYGRLWDASLFGGIRDQVTRHRSAGGGTWGLPPTWTGEPDGAYRGDRDSFLIVVDGGSIVTDPSLRGVTSRGNGDGPADGLFRGLLVRNSEVGAASVTIECILYRYVCGNHMLWGATIDRQYRRRHVGSNVERDVLQEIGKIAYQWTHHSAARDEAIIQGLIDREIASTREGVIDALRAIGFSKEQADTAYDTCERTESASPRSFWGLAQGATRASQDTPYQDARYELDKLAGLVLARGAKLVAA